MSRFRAVARMLAAAVVLAGALVVAPVARQRAVRPVFRALLRAFGVRLRVRGELAVTPGRGVLVVSNHVSWLDIVAVNAVRPMRAVAKREVAHWPVVGRLATAAGTIFLARQRLSDLSASVIELAGALRAGAVITLNPEGTTWCGSALGRFRPALFQAALDAGVPVRPVALRFSVAGRDSSAAAFVGEETLFASLCRVARLRGLVLEVVVLPEIAPGTAANRRELAALSRSAIAAALGLADTHESRVPSQGKRERCTSVVPRSR